MRSDLYLLVLILVISACQESSKTTYQPKSITAADILGNPSYQAMSYGGYRGSSRDLQPSEAELKEDMLLLHAMGIRIIRTYNVHLPHAENVLKAIRSLKTEDPDFEMYVMLGAWINCKGAWTDSPDHDDEDLDGNTQEINTAIKLTNEYEDIVKVIAVGNEAMVKWAAGYYVQPSVILKYVSQLQDLKESGALPSEVWITSSDNFASWGGGGAEYHVEDLDKLINEVDYISMHTYPMHDTHYNPEFWGITSEEELQTKKEQIEQAMSRAVDYAKEQFESVKSYLTQLEVSKPIHIGETGWASSSDGYYGSEGSRACDEYKEGLYYQHLRKWTNDQNIACFYFEAFDEKWKDAGNASGSENFFGLFTLDGQAKYAIWDLVDAGVFDGLGRGNQKVSKTYGGDLSMLLEEVAVPPLQTK